MPVREVNHLPKGNPANTHNCQISWSDREMYLLRSIIDATAVDCTFEDSCTYCLWNRPGKIIHAVKQCRRDLNENACDFFTNLSLLRHGNRIFSLAFTDELVELFLYPWWRAYDNKNLTAYEKQNSKLTSRCWSMWLLSSPFEFCKRYILRWNLALDLNNDWWEKNSIAWGRMKLSK